MRDLISGSLFSHNKRMKDSFIKSRIIRGGSAKIEQCMRTAGWDPLNPSAAVAVYIAEKTGTVNAAKIVLAGSIEKFAIDATTLFPSAPEDSTIEFSNINLGAYRFMTSHMATRWISDSDFTWTCYVKGLNQESQPEMVAVSPVNFEKHNLSHISLRILAQPISATKIKLTFGVAPVPHKTILKQDDSSDVGFPIIEVHNTAVDIFPPEGKDDQHGISFQPFILDMRKEEPDQPLPSSSVVKSYSCDLLARATMPTSKKSRKTWEDSIAKGDWSARDSSKVWPSPMESDVETENESSNISDLSDQNDTAALARLANDDLGQPEPTSEEELEAIEPLEPRQKRGRSNLRPDIQMSASQKRSATPSSSTPFKIPKKLNSQVWDKSVRPKELEDDEIFDELERSVALKAVQKEKENRLLARKLDMEQNKGKTLEKPDDPIKEVTTISECDNASNMLAASRFCLRPEVVEPSAYWDRVQYKWPEVHRSLPLQWSGREHMVSSKTIELMHDLSNVLKIEYFVPKNSGVSKGSGKHSFRRGEDGSIDIMVNEDWSTPKSVRDIKQGVRTYNILCWSLNKHNYSGFVLDEVLNKLQDFRWVTPEREQLRVLCKLTDKYFEINSGNFTRKTPPMTYKDAYTLAQTMLREEGLRADPLTNEELLQMTQGNRPLPRLVGQTLPLRTEKPKTRQSPKTKDGEDICILFNTAMGCPEGTKAGIQPGGACQRLGRKFHHVCSWFEFATKEVCAKNHPKLGNHKK